MMADIEMMFHSFRVSPQHRNFLRFLWYADNDPEMPVAKYRIDVHLFGNAPSPAIAMFGLQKTAHDGADQFGSEAEDFVLRSFYVDDGLKSVASASEAISLVKATQRMLATANIKLHKIVSNNAEVLVAFPERYRATGL